MTMTTEEYYTPPAQQIFDEIKQASIDLWQTYDDQFGYATEKVSRIKDIGNIKDNTCYMVAMFDFLNQMKLKKMVSGDTKVWLEKLLELNLDVSLDEMGK